MSTQMIKLIAKAILFSTLFACEDGLDDTEIFKPNGRLALPEELSAINKTLSNQSGFSRTPVAQNAVSYAVEAGYNIGSFFKSSKAPRIYPFIRYEYYNPQQKTEEGMLADKRFQTSMWTAGFNYFALPNFVVKADYTHRTIGGGQYNDENTVSVGFAYIGWFVKK